LNLEWFRNRLEAKVGIERWRRHYNEERPHMSLGDRTPAEFKGQIKSQSGWLGESPERVIFQ
jgi:putative transposase